MTTRRSLAWAVGALLVPLGWTSTALADGTSQAIGQSNSSSQTADADATSKQVGATNRNIVVRVLSPGDDGDVTQSNSSKATADAGNMNTTGQSAAQHATGGSAAQEIGQANGNRQSADADATSEQIKPTNDNIAVRVLSPGDGGKVSQSNSSEAGAKAVNGNATTQAAEQVAAGDCRCRGGDVLQLIGQQNHNDQHADADATSKQIEPSNQNIAVRVLSPGKDGDVSQSNSSKATSLAGNLNATEQKAAQKVGGYAASAPTTREHCGCKDDDLVLQAIGQKNGNGQAADADATSVQKKPENANLPARVLSPGGGGSVSQRNSSWADAMSGNRNATGQQATQQAGGVGCGCRGDDLVIQAIGQDNSSRQAADADATSEQWWASNLGAPLSIGGGHGHGMPAPMAELLERVVRAAGTVTQANDSQAGSKAGSDNTTRQGASQDA